mmetsp:Transcript_42548/g.83886  ORF Transcript_42548/g.83886 Transcript_42548/m.83886 type:complete len:336 (+) Transcript_42548:1014-2021(+)
MEPSLHDHAFSPIEFPDRLKQRRGEEGLHLSSAQPCCLDLTRESLQRDLHVHLRVLVQTPQELIPLLGPVGLLEEEFHQPHVVRLPRRVPGVLLLQLLGNSVFLSLAERVEHEGDGLVEVLLFDGLRQSHSRVGLCHSDDRLDVSDCHAEAPEPLRILPKLHVELLQLLKVHRAKPREDPTPCVQAVFSEGVLIQHPSVCSQLEAELAGPFCLLSQLLPRLLSILQSLLAERNTLGVGVACVRAPVGAHDEVRKSLIVDRINLVLDNRQDVKSRQDRVCKLHVLVERQLAVVSPACRICCRNHRTPCLQCGHDTDSGHRDGLLFHGLVYGRPVCV